LLVELREQKKKKKKKKKKTAELIILVPSADTIAHFVKIHYEQQKKNAILFIPRMWSGCVSSSRNMELPSSKIPS
jgi:hypothetical protein